METPSSGPGMPSEVSTAPELPPERGDREVLAFLARELLPELGSHTARALHDAVRHAVREQRLTPLERLSGRHRHELLLVIEQVAETRRRSSPAVLVRLTTIVSGTPAAPDLIGIAAARPAR
jgi:hypothetical protein